MKLRAFVLAISAVAATALYAQNPAVSDPATEAETDVLSFEQNGQLMTVPVTLSNQGPYPFLVDSGAERTIISRELAHRLALVRGRDVLIHSMTEARTLSTARIPQLQFSSRQVKDIHAPSLPAAYIGAAGILGVDSLRRQRVEFDFGKRTMTITTARAERSQWAPDAIVVTARSIYGRLVLTDAYMDGQKILAIIDTGSDLSIGNRALQDRLAKKGRLRATVPIQMRSVTGRHFTVDYTRVARVTIGGLAVSEMPIGFTDAHPFEQMRINDRPAIMLGMDTLSLFARISVDFAHKEVRFQLPETNGSAQGPLAMAAPAEKGTAPKAR